MTFLIIILIVAIIMMIPVGISVKVHDDITFKIHVFIFSLKIDFSRIEKIMNLRKNKKSKKPKKETPKPKKEKTNIFIERIKNDGIEQSIKFYLKVLKMLAKRLGRITKHVRIKKLQLAISLAGETPDKTAKQFGQINTAVSCGLKVVDSIVKIKKCDFMIKPNFIAEETKIYFYAVVKIPIYFIVTGVIFLILDYVKLQFNINKNQPKTIIKQRGK